MPQPSQSGQIRAIPQPSQSGQIPVQTAAPQPTPAPAQAPSPKETLQLPVIQPVGQVTGAHSPSQRQAQGHSTLLRVGIFAAIIAALVLAITLILVIFKPFGLFDDKLEVDRPSVSQVEEAFERANLPEPDLSEFAYVNDEDLKQTKLTDFQAGAVQYSKSNGTTEAYCDTTADVEYENDYVTVKQTLTMRMDYDKGSEEWVSGSVRGGTLSATPEGPADIEEITRNFLSILRAYDPDIAAMYAGGKTTATSNISKKGGTAEFTTSKTEGEETKTCVAHADITWSDTSGWKVDITSISGDIDIPVQEETKQEQPAQPEETPSQQPGDQQPATGTSTPGNSGDGASMILICYTGELVEITGTIQFDNSGAILLKTDAKYRVILDGNTYVVDYFEIGARAGGYVNGQRVAVIGEISYRGSIASAPLFINANY